MEYLFDPDLINQVDMSDLGLPSHLKLRPLSRCDRSNNFLTILMQLTKVGEISQPVFDSRFDQMKESKCYYVFVVTDSNQNDIVIATATLILEQKFIRQCALKGRVEEVCQCFSHNCDATVNL